MIGTHQNPGLYALAARDIFRQLEVSQPRRHLFVWISFYEIYCGQLYDLLNRRKRYWVWVGNCKSVLYSFKPESHWSFNTLVTWCKEPTHWKRPWCWERLKAKREGGGKGWDGEIASLTQWTWIWAKSGRYWRTGEPGWLQCVVLQRVGHSLAIEQEQQHISDIIRYLTFSDFTYYDNL